jgi:hypothetical protein
MTRTADPEIIECAMASPVRGARDGPDAEAAERRPTDVGPADHILR